MRVNKLSYFFVTLILIFSLLPVQAQDVGGSQDHPILTRFPGSTILHYNHKDFDEIGFPIGKVKRDMNLLPLAGELTQILYKVPEQWTVLQVFRNYEKALKDSGFEFVYLMNDTRASRWYSRDTQRFLSSKFVNEKNIRVSPFGVNPRDVHYLVARAPNGTVIALLVASRRESRSRRVSEYYGFPMVHLEILEPEGIETGLVTATAQEHAQNIVAKGSTSLPSDVLFNVDRATIKPEASGALEEAARFMKENPQLRLLVVGHTDMTGALSYNADLSLKRAQAVRRVLIENYGISDSRLEAHGAGALAPVATNSSEEGRLLNRRVEFVER